jgi:hypothetical protein
MSLPLSFLIGSTITLVIMTGVFRLEDARGRVLVFASFRQALTRFLLWCVAWLQSFHPYIGRGFIRLMLHYSAHGVLKRILRLVRRIEQWIERVMRQNRQVAKSIDTQSRQQTHLEALAEHRVETALSDREKQRRRAHN